MSSNSKEESGLGIAVVMIVAFMISMMMIVFAIFAFLSFLQTLVCIAAWDKTVRIRSFTVTPHYARAFVGGGLAGMALVPAFLVFVSVFFGTHINWDYLPHILIGGYTAGSIGVDIVFADDFRESARQAEASEDFSLSPRIETPAQTVLPPQTKQPFRFASWDDEENGQ